MKASGGNDYILTFPMSMSVNLHLKRFHRLHRQVPERPQFVVPALLVQQTCGQEFNIVYYAEGSRCDLVSRMHQRRHPHYIAVQLSALRDAAKDPYPNLSQLGDR